MTVRDVERTEGVDPPDAVEGQAVQVEEARCACGRRARCFFRHKGVSLRARGRQCAKVSNHALHIGTDGPESANELMVRVGQAWPLEAPREKDGASAQEGLDVAAGAFPAAEQPD